MITDRRYLIAKVILLIFYAVSFSASLVGIISSAMDTNNYVCDSNLLSLKIWQIVYGSVRIPLLIALLLSYECLKINKTISLNYLIVATLICGILFDSVWSIFGSVDLFAFSYTCRNEAFRLWVTSLYCLVVEYTSIVAQTIHLIWLTFFSNKMMFST